MRIGRKRAIYLPREFLEMLGLKVGDPVVVRVEADSIVIRRVPDPFLLAARRRKWASTTVGEFEEESGLEQESWDR